MIEGKKLVFFLHFQVTAGTGLGLVFLCTVSWCKLTEYSAGIIGQVQITSDRTLDLVLVVVEMNGLSSTSRLGGNGYTPGLLPDTIDERNPFIQCKQARVQF